MGARLFQKGTACSECSIGYNQCVDNLCVGARPPSPTGKYGWDLFCSGSRYTEYALGACEQAPPGASWKYHKGTIVPAFRKWYMKMMACDDPGCSSNCFYFWPQELDVCSQITGFANKFTY